MPGPRNAVDAAQLAGNLAAADLDLAGDEVAKLDATGRSVHPP